MKGNHYSDNRRRRRKPIYVKKRRRRKRTSTVIAVLLICLILIAGAGAVGFFILQEYSKDHIRQKLPRQTELRILLHGRRRIITQPEKRRRLTGYTYTEEKPEQPIRQETV